MARKVNWSYEATADLEVLAEYIARDSAFYASAFVHSIGKTFLEQDKRRCTQI